MEKRDKTMLRDLTNLRSLKTSRIGCPWRQMDSGVNPFQVWFAIHQNLPGKMRCMILRGWCPLHKQSESQAIPSQIANTNNERLVTFSPNCLAPNRVRRSFGWVDTLEMGEQVPLIDVFDCG